MLNIAVCDDEEQIRAGLAEKIEACLTQKGEPHQIDQFACADGLLDSKRQFDLVFLDIKMEGTNGMEAAKRLREQGSGSFLIFVTALCEYIPDAFEVGASSYLLKPVDDGQLARVLSRVLEERAAQRTDVITVKKGTWCTTVKLEDIYYCESIKRKIYLHRREGVLDYYCKLEELEQVLDGRFFKPHRSYLVNLQHVRGYGGGLAELDNGEQVPISRLRQQEFSQAMLLWMREENRHRLV